MRSISIIGEQLRGLRCHLIYTVPISMFYSPQASILTNIFPDYLILPMIREKNTRDDVPWQPGLDKLRQLLASRIDVDIMFTEEALTRLSARCAAAIPAT